MRTQLLCLWAVVSCATPGFAISNAKRWVAVGVNIRGIIVVVFVRLGHQGLSIISMRPANRNERKLYEER